LDVRKITESLIQAGIKRKLEEWGGPGEIPVSVEIPRQEGHGDFSTNAALQLARHMRKKPRDVATGLLDSIRREDQEGWIRELSVAGPGFINIVLSDAAWREVLAIALEIAEGLETAHAESVVHGNLSPSNVLLTEAGHVKVMDFGQVKPVLTPPKELEQASSRLLEGSTPGTFACVSPERLRGETADGRSDVFSFGVVLYEMLAGVGPFHEETPADTVSAILNLEPPALSRYRRDAPELLEHIVRKMLAKDPADRYQLVHEVATDLSHVQGLEERRQEVRAERADAQPRPRLRTPLFLKVGLASVLVLALVSVVTWWLVSESDSTSGPPTVAVLPLSVAL